MPMTMTPATRLTSTTPEDDLETKGHSFSSTLKAKRPVLVLALNSNELSLLTQVLLVMFELTVCMVKARHCDCIYYYILLYCSVFPRVVVNDLFKIKVSLSDLF